MYLSKAGKYPVPGIGGYPYTGIKTHPPPGYKTSPVLLSLTSSPHL